ncbi:MAG: beta-lactamase family protein [Deltaproteobacteria bacterium]|nr:beta-lactamase family protein [Deltaproteobacteria bacterium]
MGRLIIVFFLCCLIFPGWQASADSDQIDETALHKRIEARINAEITKNGFPSLAFGIVQGDKLVFTKYSGLADRDAKKKATSKTLYRIGSISKVFTATLLIMARDSGHLRLDDWLATYLPADIPLAFDPKGAFEITLRHLATHSSGLARMPAAMRTKKDDPYDRISKAELLAGLKQTKMDFPIGRRYSYSNLGFSLLGVVLEKAFGQPYEKILEKLLLEPLGMKDTAVSLDKAKTTRLATPYSKSNTNKKTADWKLGAFSPAGGIASTIEDMALFIALQLKAGKSGKHVVSSGSLTELHTPQRLTNNWQGAVGLGWHVQPSNQYGDIVWHNGGMDGFRSYLGFAPARQVGIVILTNCGKSVDQLGRWLLDEAVFAYGQETKTPVAEEVLSTARTLSKYIVKNPADDIADLFHAGFLKAIPLEKIKLLFSRIFAEHGQCEIAQTKAGLKPRSAKVLLNCKDGNTVRFLLQVDSGQPPKIIYLLFK